MKLPASGPEMKYRLALLSAAAAVVALFLLSAGLNQLEIGPGEYLIFPEQSQPVEAPFQFNQPDSITLFEIFVALSLLILLVFLFLVLISPERRKRVSALVGRRLLIIAGYLLILVLLNRLAAPEEISTSQPAQLPPVPQLLSAPQSDGIPVEVTPPVPPPLPPGLGYIAALLIVLVGGMAVYWLWRLRHTPEQQLHAIARSALADLAAGRDWEDIVIRLYAEMSAAVSRQLKLDRDKAMTPHEFARRLEQVGLPVNAVNSLTRLFEKARYGGRHSSKAEIQEARACLTAILQTLEGGA